jgi:hypothetical protein
VKKASQFALAPVLLDSNLLLLLVIGTIDRRLITSFKRTQHFSESDYDAVREIASLSGRLITTPHIVTETSNLANQLPDRMKERFFHTLRDMIAMMEERYTSARILSEHKLFYFGITDVAMLTEQLATTESEQEVIVLTQDGRFPQWIHSMGGTAFDLSTAVALNRSYR